MKMYRIFMTLALALAMTTTAMAQDEFGGGFGGDTEEEEDTSPAQTYTQPTAQTNVSTTSDMGSESLGYPHFALGARLELVTPANFSAALIEANLAIISRLDVYILFGLALHTTRTLDSNSPPVLDEKDRQGRMFLGGGARFNIIEPAPQHAHLYVAADLGVGLGLASFVTGGDSQGDVEDDNKEALDFFTFAAAVGMEYLIVPEFGFGPEIGLRYLVNRYEDQSVYDGANIEKAYESWLAVNFVLRFVYHF